MSTSDQFSLPQGLPPRTRRRVRVLSLSGGGYRGLFTARVIETLEARLNEGAAQPRPFGSHFDLIAGTSIGGILATALTRGVKGSALRAVLEDRGAAIFPPMSWRRLRKLVGKAPYDPRPLEAAIKALMPDAGLVPLGSHAAGLLMPTVDWTTSRLHLLGSEPTPFRDTLGLTLLDAMMATSAAPAHFPARVFRHHVFLDGGLAANAPDLHALRCAESMFPGTEITMLSIGTANLLHGQDPSDVPVRGIGWAGPIIELAMNAQEMQAVDACRAEMPGRYLRLSTPPSAVQARRLDFDVANAVSTDLLLTLADQCLGDLTKSDEHALTAIVR